MYVFRTSSALRQSVVLHQPAVALALARTLAHARHIHQSIWNTDCALYLLVLLPDQVRIYTGFRYSPDDPDEGLLDTIPLQNLDLLVVEFSSEAIDTGYIWRAGKYKSQLYQQERVGRRLLKSLRQLDNELSKQGLSASLTHAFIGKYVYIRSLWGRGILSRYWLQAQESDEGGVFAQHANAAGFFKLITALEDRFHGNIFPLDVPSQGTLTDVHVRLAASLFLETRHWQTIQKRSSGNCIVISQRTTLPFSRLNCSQRHITNG